ncbi:hypothetical protein AGMMS49938_17260 [Fibrobacterales bacterium]|nr:hypothetical protein AGMMS49938_17260 [Fibrobacterales bacterium]
MATTDNLTETSYAREYLEIRYQPIIKQFMEQIDENLIQLRQIIQIVDIFCDYAVRHYPDMKLKSGEAAVIGSIFPRLNDLGYSVLKNEKGIFINGNNLKIFGTANNTLWTAEGVLSGEYDFDNHGEDFIAIDIGMNIGLASLYLARKEFIKKVYSFEPFEPIFIQAKNNINNNPQISSKIEIFNFGLSDENKTIEVFFNSNLPGQMSSVNDRFSIDKNLPKQSAILKKASEIIIPIFAKHKEKIMLKIDCEGGEREILPDLQSSGLLKQVSVIIMEYHDNYYKPLVELLKESGFQTKIYNQNYMEKVGMIYAEKLNCKSSA